MPLLDIKQTRKVTVTCTLEDSIATQADQYAAFVGVPADQVVNEALKYVFAKDGEFQKYRSTAPTVTAQLRIKKPASVAPAARRSAKPESVHA